MAGRVWKDGTRRGIAYVEGREAAQQVIEMAGRVPAPSPERARRKMASSSAADGPLDGAMAVYMDRRGKPFAWQIPFDIGCWERIAALVGNE